MEMFGGMFVMVLLVYSLIHRHQRHQHGVQAEGREVMQRDLQAQLRVRRLTLPTLTPAQQHVYEGKQGLYSFLADSPMVSELMMRGGGGLLLGGGVIFGAHTMMIGRVTDSATRPNVARMFVGLNLVLCGLIGMGALLAGCTMITQQYVPEDGLKIVMVLMAVYLTAWGLQARKLIAYSPRA